MWCPATIPSRPAPASSRTSVGNTSVMPCSRAARTRAAASTWDETWSTEAARRKSSAGSVHAPQVATRARCGMPDVSVPVLSRNRISACANASRTPPPLTMMPRRAVRETPATIAIGTASRSGHGVATTSTARARTGSPDSDPGSARDQYGQRDKRRGVAVGESYVAGALDCCAASTRRTMPV